MSTPPPPYLTDEEISQICDPLTQAAAQIRFLRRIGLKVEKKPGGHALVSRAEFERAMGAERQMPHIVEPSASNADVIALRQHWANRRVRNGAATRGR